MFTTSSCIYNTLLVIVVIKSLYYVLVVFFYCIETWILYGGAEQGVSKVVRDAYKYYEDIEFKTKSTEKEISDPDRHVKLISMAGNEVQIIVKLY